MDLRGEYGSNPEATGGGLMIIDSNAYIGNWPFRKIRYNTAEGLLRLMDREGIDRAMVGSLSSVFYRNAQVGNEELFQEVRGHEDRLIPLATINPGYPNWKRDFERCRCDLGMKGLKLYPMVHGYELWDEPALRLIRWAAECGMPVVVPMRIEDERIQHGRVNVPQFTLEPLIVAIRRCPETPFILGAASWDMEKLADGVGPRQENFYIGISRLPAFCHEMIPKLIDRFGVSRIVFDTNMPLDVPRCALLKVESLDLSEVDKQKIYGENMARILGID